MAVARSPLPLDEIHPALPHHPRDAPSPLILEVRLCGTSEKVDFFPPLLPLLLSSPPPSAATTHYSFGTSIMDPPATDPPATEPSKPLQLPRLPRLPSGGRTEQPPPHPPRPLSEPMGGYVSFRNLILEGSMEGGEEGGHVNGSGRQHPHEGRWVREGCPGGDDPARMDPPQPGQGGGDGVGGSGDESVVIRYWRATAFDTAAMLRPHPPPLAVPAAASRPLPATPNSLKHQKHGGGQPNIACPATICRRASSTLAEAVSAVASWARSRPEEVDALQAMVHLLLSRREGRSGAGSMNTTA